MQDVMGLGLFSVATGSFMFEKCWEHNGISDAISLVAWIVLPLVTICYLLEEKKSTDLTATLVVSNLFIVSFYVAFLRTRFSSVCS